MSTEQLHRDIGRLEGKVEALTTQVSGMDAKLDAALDYIAREKGARKATVFISTGVSSLIAFAVGLAVQVWGPHP
jgi:hypothetical protein